MQQGNKGEELPGAEFPSDRLPHVRNSLHRLMRNPILFVLFCSEGAGQDIT